MIQIEAENLAFAYGKSIVLEEISLRIEAGDFVAVIGPNGGGKSTFLKLILGLLPPASGTLRVMGTTPAKAAPKIGYVPQEIHPNRGFPVSVLEVVQMGLLKRTNLLARHSRADHEKAMAHSCSHFKMMDCVWKKRDFHLGWISVVIKLSRHGKSA